MSEKIMVGGQAVIEGVMMRASETVATAVREPSGNIAIDIKPINSWAKRFPILKKPLLRGVAALFESMIIGLRALSYSAKMAGEDESERLTNKDIAITMAFSFSLAIVLFVVIPTYSASFTSTESSFMKNMMEGLIRILVFFLYIWGISRSKDIQRVFKYHGAEHKTIHAYENGEELTVENVKKYSRLHPRCGTSFLLVVMIVSILTFAFLGWPDLVERITSRIILLPIIAGVSYEFIRLAGKSNNLLVKIISKPGLLMQHLTTKEPDDEMMEVSIASLKAVVAENEKKDNTLEFIQ